MLSDVETVEGVEDDEPTRVVLEAESLQLKRTAWSECQISSSEKGALFD